MFRLLGILAGSLSLAIMFWRGYNIEMGQLLVAILNFYEHEMSSAFGLVEPLIVPFLRWLNGLFGVSLEIAPHWKHVFVLLWLYFGARTQLVWRWRTPANRIYGTYLFAIGIFCALSAGIISGITSGDRLVDGVVVILSAAMGIFIFETLRVVFTFFFFDKGRSPDGVWGQLPTARCAPSNAVSPRRNKQLGLASFIGVTLVPYIFMNTLSVIIGLVLINLWFSEDLDFGLVFLTIFVALLTTYWLWVGTRERRGIGANWVQRLFRDGATRLAVSMLSTILSAAFIVLLGALTVARA